MKSTTIWVSEETKKMADKLKGNKSYNKFFRELMERTKDDINIKTQISRKKGNIFTMLV